MLSLFALLSTILTNLTLTQDHVLRLDSNSIVLHFVLFFFLISASRYKAYKVDAKVGTSLCLSACLCAPGLLLGEFFSHFAPFIFLHHHHHPHQKAGHLYYNIK